MTIFSRKTGKEIFTLDEGPVEIIFPEKLSGESLKDLKEYLDIFYRKACRLTDDPHDPFVGKFEGSDITFKATG